MLEVVARMPYFAYISMLHLYESLGWWRAGAELRRVSDPPLSVRVPVHVSGWNKSSVCLSEVYVTSAWPRPGGQQAWSPKKLKKRKEKGTAFSVICTRSLVI